MKHLTEEQKNDELVKSLISDGGFSEEVVAGWIEDGTIKLEKSVQTGLDDHGEGDGDGEHEKKEKKDKKDDEKDPDEGGDADGEGDKKDIAKSLGLDVFMKSMKEEILSDLNGQNEEILKSIDSKIEKSLGDIADKFEKSLDAMRKAIVAFGESAPNFKTAGLSKAIIEKSIEHGGGAKDEDNKTVLSVSRDRSVVRELLMKSIDEESDPEIQKSLRENCNAYVLDPIYGAVGEFAAKYMYEHKNVRLVK